MAEQSPDSNDVPRPPQSLANARKRIFLSIQSFTQRLRALPALGILFIVSWKQRRLAARDAAFAIFFGAIGIWLPLLLRYGIDANDDFNARLQALALRGDPFILVPSLLAPLYLLLGSLESNERMRRHQVALFAYSAFVTGLALLFWARSSSSTTVGTWIISQIVFAVLGSFFLLFVFYLITEHPQDVLQLVKRTSTSLTEDVIKSRAGKDK